MNSRKHYVKLVVVLLFAMFHFVGMKWWKILLKTFDSDRDGWMYFIQQQQHNFMQLSCVSHKQHSHLLFPNQLSEFIVQNCSSVIN